MRVLPVGDGIDFSAGAPRTTWCTSMESRLRITPTSRELHVAAACVALARTNSCAVPGSEKTRSLEIENAKLQLARFAQAV
jgi:hypothetical protein